MFAWIVAGKGAKDFKTHTKVLKGIAFEDCVKPIGPHYYYK
jgi:hypothetical protein